MIFYPYFIDAPLILEHIAGSCFTGIGACLPRRGHGRDGGVSTSVLFPVAAAGFGKSCADSDDLLAERQFRGSFKVAAQPDLP